MTSEFCLHILASSLLCTRSHLSHSVMISVGFSVLGVTGLHLVNSGVKINGKYYRDTLLKEELLPDMRIISEYFIFQQDSTPAKETIDLLTETPAFTRLTVRIWYPVDCKVWLLLQLQVYKVKVICTSVSGMNLTSVLLTRWSKDQTVAHSPKSLCQGQRWPLWAQTLQTTLVQNDHLHECFRFCTNLSGYLFAGVSLILGHCVVPQSH